MRDELIIRPLRCGQCGAELPVMGQLVTFRCPSCCNYWVLGENGLEPIFVYRALPEDSHEPAGSGGGMDDRDELMLPFWVAEIDGADLRARLLGEASGGVPPTSEISYLLSRLESAGNPRIYVPAFRSPNTYAYLKVGRLLTRLQPTFRIVRSDSGVRPVLCALRSDEAIALIDFIFFATLPDAIQSNGDLLERIHLTPARPPRLVEFPFRSRGASLVSIIGGFWISGRLVEQVGALVE